MSLNTLFLIILALGITLAGIFVLIICTKVWQARQIRVQGSYRQAIKPDLEKLLGAPDSDYEKLLEAYMRGARTKTKSKTYTAVLETVLLEYLTNPGSEEWGRALSISYDLGLPRLCLSQIKSRNSRKVSFGCRRAGLYRYKEAVPYMFKALDILASDTQFQILMGLSRIGDVSAMQQAFDSISRYVIVNERAAFEILSAFSGDKHSLYKYIINNSVDYVTVLFLKAIDGDTAKKLMGDIVSLLNSGGKELRAAAIKAIGKMGKDAPTKFLVRALDDPDWEVRAISAKILGILKDPGAGAALAKAIQDPEWWVRQNAVEAIFSYPECEELLLEVIKSKDAYACDSINYALEKMSNQVRLLVTETELDGKKLKKAVLKEGRILLTG